MKFYLLALYQFSFIIAAQRYCNSCLGYHLNSPSADRLFCPISKLKM